MKKIAQVTYQRNLRTAAVHLASNNEIITDAPTDNNGKGEAFSPTDLVATALASCMITILGIRADKLEVDITGTTASITKIMASDPRRIAEVQVTITMPDQAYDTKSKKVLEAAARTCPVALSLNAELIQTVNFIWN